MPFLDMPTGAVFYTAAGAGAPLVLLHGFCADHRSWAPLVERLAIDYRVLTPDLPGCGRSALPDGLRLSQQADAVAALLDALDLPAAVVLGHSMGGYVALEFAARYPERLRALGLLHAHPYARLSAEGAAERRRSIDFMERFGAALYVKQLIPTLFAPDYTDRLEIEKQTYRALETPVAGLIACQRAMLHRADHAATLTALPVPVLQVHGAHDVVIPTGIQERASVLPADGHVHWLPRTGHCATLEEPKKLARLLRQFLNWC